MIVTLEKMFEIKFEMHGEVWVRQERLMLLLVSRWLSELMSFTLISPVYITQTERWHIRNRCLKKALTNIHFLPVHHKIPHESFGITKKQVCC